MRKVIVSAGVHDRINDLKRFLTQEYKISRSAANARIDRLHASLAALETPGDSTLCCFRKWRSLGYRCMVFEGWAFAYQIVPEGVIVHDMLHGKLIADVEY